MTLRRTASGEIVGKVSWDIGLLYGRASISQDYHASFSAGIALMGGQTSSIFSDRAHDKITPRISFPIEAQLFLLSRKLGFGVTGLANINNARSFAGMVVTF